MKIMFVSDMGFFTDAYDLFGLADILGRKRIDGYEVLILAIGAAACPWCWSNRVKNSRPDGQAGSAVPRGLDVNADHRRVFLQARLEPGELRVAGVVHPVDDVIQIV